MLMHPLLWLRSLAAAASPSRRDEADDSDTAGNMSGTGVTTGRSPDELEARILALEGELRTKECEILELRSQLDKFQSVFPFHVGGGGSPTASCLGVGGCGDTASGGASGSGAVGGLGVERGFKLGDSVRRRKQRAQGISAEPSDATTIQELSSATFPTYTKSERHVKDSKPQNEEMLRFRSNQHNVTKGSTNSLSFSVRRTRFWPIADDFRTYKGSGHVIEDSKVQRRASTPADHGAMTDPFGAF